MAFFPKSTVISLSYQNSCSLKKTCSTLFIFNQRKSNDENRRHLKPTAIPQFSGRHQDSETLTQLRQLISSRRQTPEMAVGWWRWGITMIGGISQIVVHVV